MTLESANRLEDPKIPSIWAFPSHRIHGTGKKNLVIDHFEVSIDHFEVSQKKSTQITIVFIFGSSIQRNRAVSRMNIDVLFKTYSQLNIVAGKVRGLCRS